MGDIGQINTLYNSLADFQESKAKGVFFGITNLSRIVMGNQGIKNMVYCTGI